MAVTRLQAKDQTRNKSLLVHRLYVPAASILLVLIVGNWLAKAISFNPLTAAQNQRIRFQEGGESSSTPAGDLTPVEAALAESVLDKHRDPAVGKLQLLYIGNSQSIAIMDQQSGDLVSPQWLQVLLNRQTKVQAPLVDVQVGSLPNITATELLIKTVAVEEQGQQNIILLGSAVLEEFRGLGVRDEIAALTLSPAIKARLTSLAANSSDMVNARKALEPFVGTVSSLVVNSSSEPVKGSVANTLELKLQSAAGRLPLFAQREALFGNLALGYHSLRNHILRITSSSIRPVPDAAYQTSLELIELTLRYAQSKGIHVVFYLAPIRPIQPNPNLPSDIERFRRDVPAICQRYLATCLDYVDLIPEQLWTNYPDDAVGTEGQRDFAHFTGMAHKLLAQQLMTDIGSSLIQWSQEKGSTQR